MRPNVTSIQLGSSTNLAVLAPVKAGFTDAFETITYVARLQRLLDALHASRQNMREAELFEPVFPDTIGRFGVIQTFRYAIWPGPRKVQEPQEPQKPQEPGPFYLSLNVTFDGGWEPYMRVIYRDIGALLDALFCHCEGYPGASRSSFDDYCRWVRSNELRGGIFYADSAATPADAHYHARAEQLLLATTDVAEVARLRTQPALQRSQQAVDRIAKLAPLNALAALAVSLRTLKGLYRLVPLFAGGTSGDGDVLRNFAHLVLSEFRQLLADSRFAPAATLLRRDLLRDELAWFEPALAAAPKPEDDLTFDPALLQDAILHRDDPVTHGALALLSVQTAAQARAFIGQLADQCKPPSNARAVRHLVAFTHAGLVALEISGQRLDLLPPEFAQGMEPRAGILGDVRSNHPHHWRRPLRHGAPAQSNERIDLGLVHVVVQLRLVQGSDSAAQLQARLDAATGALVAPGSGMQLLALEATWARAPGERDHFGFADGISQPQVRQPLPDAHGSDEVSPGELLLGYRNDRGDLRCPKAPEPLLDNGSFLVVRKLRQRLDHLDQALAGRPDAAAVKAKMMGRQQDGTPLLASGGSAGDNSFTYQADPQGVHCPFQSHVRRSNPRDGRAYTPRILRRGMSWGPRVDAADKDAERGVMFMAFCGSIAEQFETVQGWIAAGNSSGVSSTLADPFLAVPRQGQPGVFRCFSAPGVLEHVALGSKPLVELQWGLYLFVPSLQALGQLNNFTTAAPVSKPGNQTASDPVDLADAARRWLDDEQRAEATWKAVRKEPNKRLHATDYGTLLAGMNDVKAALGDAGGLYSVQGYGDRMHATMGNNILGQDPHHAERRLAAPVVNAAVEGLDEEAAFVAAWPHVLAELAAFALLDLPRPPELDSAPVRRPIDLVAFSERVMARLCKLWFGLPNELDMKTGGWTNSTPATAELPRCPGSLLSSSRYIFGAHPRDPVVQRALLEGPLVLQAVRGMFAQGRVNGELTQVIVASWPKQGFADAAARQDALERNISGMLLGFPPAVHGNFLRTLRDWIEGGSLWQQQQALASTALPAQPSAQQHYTRARDTLRRGVLDAMQRHPVPENLRRCPVDQGTVNPARGAQMILGIGSAIADAGGPAPQWDELVFGGSRNPQSPIRGQHACPGYGMAVGVLLALITALLDAGTLRPTGSPVQLILTPRS